VLANRVTHSDAAVIDVGSNSVRLVQYRLEGRAIWTVYNEKVLAGLGRDLAVTGRLSPDGATAAIDALARFRVLIDAAKPDAVFTVATAAVRDSADGPAFCHRVKERTGLDLRVLSGEEEARYAALGVLAGLPHATGLVGDLGGASLELTRILDGDPGQGVTLPLGPFSIADRGKADPDKVRAAIERHLRPVAGRFGARSFNAVGGAWRNFALIHMRMSGYPLEIVHEYEIEAQDALEAAAFVSRQSKGSLDRIEGISRRRLETLPHAALVLEGLIQHLGIERIVLSAYGLREGLLLEAASPRLRHRDPLIEGCAALGARFAVAEPLGAALEAWLAEPFSRLEALFGARDPTLLAAACRLAELGAQLHPDHRARLIFDQVLRAPIAGMDHAERVFLACAAFARHSASPNFPQPDITARLLTSERRQRARVMGAALRLGCDLSGRNPELLEHARLEFRPEAVVLGTSPMWGAILLSEQTNKRAATLASALERPLQVETRATGRAETEWATA
jgi:exopolyphosphatase/guanosine-5'-triphosphate,3'-diphosphate pyrophosphatase